MSSKKAPRQRKVGSDQLTLHEVLHFLAGIKFLHLSSPSARNLVAFKQRNKLKETRRIHSPAKSLRRKAKVTISFKHVPKIPHKYTFTTQQYQSINPLIRLMQLCNISHTTIFLACLRETTQHRVRN